MTEELNKDRTPLTDVTVSLVGIDGNAFNLIGRVRTELRRAGYDKDFLEQFTKEATSGDYFHLLNTIGKYVHIE